jgi:hypothetical protein
MGCRWIAAGSQVAATFGLGTECGWGRQPTETIPALIDIHAAVADTVANNG